MNFNVACGKSRIKIFCLAAAALALAGCRGTDKQQLVITGSSTIAPVAAELAKAFEAQHPNVRIDVQTGGSSRGLRDVRSGLADIGMVSRAVTADDAVHSTLLARDGLAIITHRSNPIAELSAEQLRAIYRGELSHWPTTGQPITAVHKADGRSTQQVFLQHFALQPAAIKAGVIVGDNEQGIKTVAGNPTAIGYVSIGSAQYSADHGVAIKLLPLNGIAATTENVQQGHYALARTLNWVTAGEPTDLRRDFIAFAATPQGSDIIRSLYFVPVN